MLKTTPASVSLQFFAPGDDQPTAGYEIRKDSFELPPGANLPRVGEFFTHSQWKESDDLIRQQFVVLAINTHMSDFDEHPGVIGWHTVITLGPVDVAENRILSIIAA